MTEALPSAGRLRWLCRRGTRELDRILGGFLAEDYPAAAPAVRQAFVELLHCQDPDIYDWLMGSRRPPTVQLQALVELLQAKYGVGR